MAIDFSLNKWDTIKDTYNKLWTKELDRPIIGAVLNGKDPGRMKPDVPLLSQATCSDLSFSAEELIDRIDYEFSCQVFLGDTYPHLELSSFGPGILTAILGATLDTSTGSVWFHPKEKKSIKDIHFEYDPDNIWLNRIKDIYRAGIDRWQGQVQMGIPDLGGSLDTLSTFRPGENLLYDLYDYPEEVKRLNWEAHNLWFKIYNEFKEIIDPYNPGVSNWGAVLSPKSTYILQCDFCYMLGPDMFDEFVIDELNESINKLSNTIYHLDGPGEIVHLDKILANDKLDGLQWVPGAGQKPHSEWPEIYQKINSAGKFIHMYGGFEEMEKIMQITGSRKDIYHQPILGNISQTDELTRKLGKYGAV